MAKVVVDEHWGQGGTYLQDPKTGKRTLIERTEPADFINPEPEEVLSDAAPEAQNADPGENGNDVRDKQ